MFFIVRAIPSLGIKMGCCSRPFESSYYKLCFVKVLIMVNAQKFVVQDMDLCQFDIEFVEV